MSWKLKKNWTPNFLKTLDHQNLQKVDDMSLVVSCFSFLRNKVDNKSFGLLRNKKNKTNLDAQARLKGPRV
jgi:hypothetical protein